MHDGNIAPEKPYTQFQVDDEIKKKPKKKKRIQTYSRELYYFR